MSDILLYHGLASTCSKKVRLCLYEKGVPFRSRLLDLQKFEQHDPAYLALNRNGVVPTLVHKGKPIIESSIIIEYIDDCFSQVPLKPKDAYGRSQMRLWTRFSDEVGYKAVYVATWHKLRSRAKEGLAKDKLQSTLSRIPDAERRERWEQMSQGGYSDAELEKAHEQMRSCVRRVEEGLTNSPWLAGETYSLADIAVVPFIDRIRNLQPDYLTKEEYPKTFDWFERVQARPAFEKAFRFTADPRAKELPNL